jgi:dUTP pyrophosphatase
MFDRNVFVDVFNGGDQPLPRYAHQGDAGADLHSNEQVKIYPGETRPVKTGLFFAIPLGYEVQVRPRSGMSAKTKIRVANSPGTIDHQYRGELMVLCENIGDEPYEIAKGDRIAQMVLAPVWNAMWSQVSSVDQLGETDRGTGGFGSTGV